MGFVFWEFRVQGLGHGVLCLGLRVKGLGIRAWKIVLQLGDDAGRADGTQGGRVRANVSDFRV